MRPRGRGRGRPPGPAGAASAAPISPWDAASEGSAQTLQLERNNALAGLAGDQAYEEQQTGFGSGASNPYSQAALLQRQRRIGQRANLQGAGNHLYSGSTVNHARGVQRAYNQGFTQLQQQVARAQELRRREKQGIETDYQSGIDQAREGAIDRTLSQAPEPAPVGVGRGRRPKRGRGR